jgi:hypothetical protein
LPQYRGSAIEAPALRFEGFEQAPGLAVQRAHAVEEVIVLGDAEEPFVGHVLAAHHVS